MSRDIVVAVPSRRPSLRATAALVVATMLAVLLPVLVGTTKARAAGPCDAPVTNPVACENTKAGTPDSVWDISGSGDDSLQGFATDISVNVGTTEQFKIKSSFSSYTIDIYRLGWYGGNGARKIGSVTPSVALPQNQPPCISDANTNNYDCGNWAVSASWAVPSDAVSGVYIARLTGPNDAGSQITFIVRNDASRSAIDFQTSDSTWDAYNNYGGSNLYYGPNGRAYKVSYNRPYANRGQIEKRDFLFGNEYPMIRFLERNGYDVSYTTDLDSDRRGALIKNHQTFLSVGHDEYWSGAQRANVTAARDAGVNLAFFSGNEVYWKTRWEPSIAGTSTPNRTLVTYKETYDDVRDPQDPPTSTTTWRDPRYSPPGDAGKPENGLTGTAFMVNAIDSAIQVPAADGKMRLWRNTTVATQGAGAVATLGAHTLGYESDEDLDNGSRPAGLVDLSTTGPVATSQYLLDYGHNVGNGTTTHHMTLYKAASGALVFAAGTIQYSWGLDSFHDDDTGTTVPTNQPMQQATVNLLADMGAQPATLMTGLVGATKSTDTVAPTSTITSPAQGATIASGKPLTVTGTATDAGGGAVAGVEVSIDGGATWHPAVGRGSWTYTADATGAGAVSIRSRATDDSANTETPSAGRAVTVTCPCSIFGTSATPKVSASSGDTGPLELGTRFTSDVDGYVTGVRFYKGPGNTGTHTGSLWSAAGTQLATGTFTNETSTGWQTLTFASPVQITKNTAYVASYFAPVGREAADAGVFAGKGVDFVPLHAPADSAAAPNGVYLNGGTGFPTNTYGSTNYWVDPMFTNVAPVDTLPPTVTTKTPLAGSSSIAPSIKPTATFSEAVQQATIGFTLKNAAGTAVAGTVGYDTAARVATFTPSAALAAGTTYTATIAGVKDTAGNTIAAPVTWTFTTAQATPTAGVCPCSIWNDSTVPDLVDSGDAAGVELGVKFRSDSDGSITAVRFYKAATNLGTHVGSLWSATGAKLASGTFGNESSAGWQTLTFATPVAVTKNTTYIASYYAPQGHYSATNNGFSAAGVDSPPLHALANGADGSNGVYAYGAASAFPTNGSTSNYWVDVVLAVAADTTAPTVTARNPAPSATGVAPTAPVAATFSEPVQPATVTFGLTGPGGATVPGAVSYNATTNTASFTPTAALAQSTVYTATLSGAKDTAGNTMATLTWTFTTGGPTSCPCSVYNSSSVPSQVDSGDPGSVELGMKFRSDVDGTITGVRFYKAASNTGTHVGTLWSATGAQLGRVTFTGESASGWQLATFATPVNVTANTTYIVSYLAPAGHYSDIPAGFTGAVDNPPLHGLANGTDGGNGVYQYGAGGFPTQTYNSTSYAVDVVFTTGGGTTPGPDTTPPTVTTQSPAAGATAVATTAKPAATFSEAVQANTVQMTLASAAGTVASATAYDATSKTATLTPTAALAANTTYTVTVSGAKDTAGNLMSPSTWTFTTAAAPPAPTPVSIFPSTAAPTTFAGATGFFSGGTETGVKIRTTVAGKITAIKFYKDSRNTGTHTGSIWNAAGTKLGGGTFSGETASGWQTLTLATPVTVAANTTYVISTFTTKGYYGQTTGTFTNAGVTNGSLTALRNGTDGGNGVNRANSTGFPTTSGNGTNYWVDLVFLPSA